MKMPSWPRLAAALLLCAAPAAAAEFTANLRPLPESVTAANFKVWLPEAVTAAAPPRLVVLVSDYEAGRELYADPAWRALAEQTSAAIVLHKIEQGAARHKLVKGDSAATALEKGLEALAEAASQPELARVPWVLTGLSQSGWQAQSVANRRPGRTLAVVVFHASTSPQSPEEYLHPAGRQFPVLLSMAGEERFPIEMLSFARTAAQRGQAWTYSLQPGVPHHRLGPQEFPLRWLAAVVEQRLGPDGQLRPLRETGSWRAAYEEFSPQPNRRKAAKAEIFPADAVPPEAARHPLLWLPDEATAKAWQAAVTAEPVRANPAP